MHKIFHKLTSEETIFVDDKEAYVEGATNAGMHAILHRENAETMRHIEDLRRVK